MAGDSWEEHRLLIMDKLSIHTGELANIRTEIATFKSDFQVSMTELKTKMMIASTVITMVVGTVVTFVMGKVL